MNKPDLIVILGPTASGKTRLAVAVAEQVGGEIISADSRQVFRGMNIGSGKDLHEYGTVPYHLIDVLDAGSEFSVFEFQRHFHAAFAQIRSHGVLPILCGGSGMYLDAIIRGYRLVEVPRNEALRATLASKTQEELAAELWRLRPEQHNSTDLTDRERTIRAIEISMGEAEAPAAEGVLPQITPLVIGIRWEREQLRQRITARLKERLEHGMIEEVAGLHANGVPWEVLDYYGLEYRYVGAFLRGTINRNDMFQRLNSAIHEFAKRQGNWFRRMERHGVAIHWVEGGDEPLLHTMAVLHSAGIHSVVKASVST